MSMGSTENDDRPTLGINHLTVIPRNFKGNEEEGNEETDDGDEESSADDTSENPSFAGRGI